MYTEINAFIVFAHFTLYYLSKLFFQRAMPSIMLRSIMLFVAVALA